MVKIFLFVLDGFGNFFIRLFLNHYKICHYNVIFLRNNDNNITFSIGLAYTDLVNDHT